MMYWPDRKWDFKLSEITRKWDCKLSELIRKWEIKLYELKFRSVYACIQEGPANTPKSSLCNHGTEMSLNSTHTIDIKSSNFRRTWTFVYLSNIADTSTTDYNRTVCALLVTLFTDQVANFNGWVLLKEHHIHCFLLWFSCLLEVIGTFCIAFICQLLSLKINKINK